MKKFISFLFVAILLCFAANSYAAMGYVSAKSSDVDIKLFGSEQMWPTFISNASFNSDVQGAIGREDGNEREFDIRNQFRMGWDIQGDKWTGFFILEDDINATKTNTDRVENGLNSSGGFGLEKLQFTYEFCKCFVLEAGWNDKFLDIQSGGLLYGDDHPFIGFKGGEKNWNYELLFLSIRNDGKDNIKVRPGATFNGSQDNLFAYTAKFAYTFDTGAGKFTVSPFAAYQNNSIARANSYYFGFEGYGKLGMITPRFEVVYAGGKQDGVTNSDKTVDNLDISAWAAYLSFEFAVNKAFNPYIGGYYISGDGDGNDGDISNFQGITGISKFTSTFGMGYGDAMTDTNALGMVLYDINPILVTPTGAALGSGYGGIGGASKNAQPGLIFLGLGFKGDLSDVMAKGLSYKIQTYYLQYEDTGALEDYAGRKISDDLAWGFTWNLSYALNKHFTVLNTSTVIIPDNAIEDLRNSKDYNDTMFVNTTELVWRF